MSEIRDYGFNVETEKMSLEELKEFFAGLNEKLNNEYGKNFQFFVTDDMDIFVAEICLECGGMKYMSADLGVCRQINPDILAKYNNVNELAEELNIELHIATNTADCECNTFYCENCGDNYEVEELYKTITIDDETFYFCSEDCYEEWKESNDYNNDEEDFD